MINSLLLFGKCPDTDFLTSLKAALGDVSLLIALNSSLNSSLAPVGSRKKHHGRYLRKSVNSRRSRSLVSRRLISGLVWRKQNFIANVK